MTVNIFAANNLQTKLSEYFDTFKSGKFSAFKINHYSANKIKDIIKNLQTISRQYSQQIIYFIIDLRKRKNFTFDKIAGSLNNSGWPCEFFILLDESNKNLTVNYKLFIKNMLKQIDCKVKYILSNRTSDDSIVEINSIIEVIATYIYVRNNYNIFNIKNFMDNSSLRKGDVENFFMVLGQKKYNVSKERIKKTIIIQLLNFEFNYPDEHIDIDAIINKHIINISNIDDLEVNLISLCFNKEEQLDYVKSSHLVKLYGKSVTYAGCTIDDYFHYNIKSKEIEVIDISYIFNGKDLSAVKRLLNNLSNQLEHLNIQTATDTDWYVDEKTSFFDYWINFSRKKSTISAAKKYLKQLYASYINKYKQKLILNINENLKLLRRKYIELSQAIHRKTVELTLQLDHTTCELLDSNTKIYAERTKEYITYHEKKYFEIFSDHDFDSIYKRCEAFSEEIMEEYVEKNIYDEIRVRIKEPDIKIMMNTIENEPCFYAHVPVTSLNTSCILLTGYEDTLPNAVKLGSLEGKFMALFIGAPVLTKDLEIDQ
jgi:hypothetical protein